MHLISRYALSTGLKIDNPQITATFYPVVADKYVVFHTSAKDNLRDYDYWQEVKLMLNPVFQKLGLKTVQVGLEKDPTIYCDIDLRGKTDINQMAYIIKNCDCFIGVDSFPAHLSGYYEKKMLSIYANSYAACVYPYWGNKSNKKIIETHRPNGEKPSFSFNENPKTINRLKPDEIAQHFCELIDPTSIESLPKVHYIGDKYNVEQIEIVPDQPYAINHPNTFIRMDMLHNEESLYSIVINNSVSIVTKAPFDDKILNSNKIKLINYVAEEFDHEFVKKVKHRGIDMHLICTNKNTLKNQRVKFFDFKVLHFDQEEKINKAKESINIEEIKDCSISSRKKVFKNQTQYNSHYEANGRENIDDLLLDLEWLMLYDKNDQVQ